MITLVEAPAKVCCCGAPYNNPRECDVHNLSRAVPVTLIVQRTTLSKMVKDILIQTLKLHHGNVAGASRALNITRKTFYNRLGSGGIQGIKLNS